MFKMVFLKEFSKVYFFFVKILKNLFYSKNENIWAFQFKIIRSQGNLLEINRENL